MATRLDEALDSAADFLGCERSEFAGATLADVLADCDRDNGIVLWGLWTDAELETVIV